MIQIVRIAAIAVLAAVLLAGCGGSSGSSADPSSTGASREAVQNLRSLVTISPEATGWTWPVKPQTRTASPSFTMDPSEPSYTIQKALSDAYDAAGIRQLATSNWWDGTLKKASSFANLVSTAAGAESAMEAEREFAHAWFTRFERAPIHDIKSDGIGEHSWAVRADTTSQGFAEIGWTRGNLVLSVYISCYPCHSDVADAARSWAETIDSAATAGPH